MLKIAHIATDEKFIENAVDIFEAAYPEQNTFYITTPKPWRHIKDKDIYRELNKKKWLQLLLTQRNELKAYDLIVLHSLQNSWLIQVVMLKQNYIWLGWGGDYYSRSFDKNLIDRPLILSKTLEQTKSIINNNPKRCKLNFNLSFLKPIVKRLVFSKFIYQLAMRNIKVFSPVLPQEYDMVKEKYGLGKHTQYAPWNYGILEKHLIKNIQLSEINTANTILLGNSATATNNHIEALDVLVKSGTTRTIYLPLSYGDENYAKSVKKYIQTKPQLLNQCQVLDTFMPLAEYNAIINGCGFVIMNHVRQQALGNIITLIYRGSKIFLREDSVLYCFFKSLNANIYSVEQLELQPKLLDEHLTHEQIEHNREILKGIWSENVVFKRTKALVEAALK